jgi:hypothetical protein
MNYFLKGLASGNKLYWAGVAFLGAWMVGLIDVISSAIKPPGLANGKWFKIMLVITLAAPVVYYIYDATRRKKKAKIEKNVSEEAAVFEPEREEEIRLILEKNPDFVTHCFQCIHFDSNLLHCAKQLSEDTAYQHMKEIKINDKKYCLYWTENPDAVEY